MMGHNEMLQKSTPAENPQSDRSSRTGAMQIAKPEKDVRTHTTTTLTPTHTHDVYKIDLEPVPKKPRVAERYLKSSSGFAHV
jgi:hypothetical protein